MKKILAVLLLTAVAGATSCRKGTAPANNAPAVPALADRVPADFLTHLTKEDLAILTKDWPREQLQSLSSEPSKRQEMLKELKELLSQAVEAFNTGLVDPPEMKDQLALLRTLAIAQTYAHTKQPGGGDPFAFLKQEEVDAYLKQAGMDAKFDSFIKTAQAAKMAPDDIPTEQRDKMKQQWARLVMSEERSIKDGVAEQHETKLQITLQEAQFLAQKFAAGKFAEQTKATDSELADYLSKHPELDSSKARAKAEELLRRARSGEDFAKLARENTDDPGSKASGGFYDWFARGRMVKEFDEAAFRLEVGEISDLVETQFGYHIIKVEGKRTQKNPENGKDEEQVQVRHILISTQAPADPSNPGAQPLSPREKARTEVEKEKRDRLMKEIVARSGVTLPDDFEVKVPPPEPGAPAGPPEGAGPSMPPGAGSGPR